MTLNNNRSHFEYGGEGMSFHFDTSGCCLLCLQLITCSGEGEEKISQVSISALLKYLMIDLKDVLREGTLSRLFNQTNLRWRDIRADLCGKCSAANKRVSEQFVALEKLQLELRYSAENMRRRILNGSEVPNRIQQFEKRMSSGTHSKIDGIAKLRKRLLSECSKVISRGIHLRVSIEKIQVDSTQTFRSEDESPLEPKLTSVPSTEDTTQTCNSPVILNNRNNIEKPPSPELPGEGEKFKTNGTASEETKCEMCGKDFATVTTLKKHREAVHLGIRHKCRFPNCGRSYQYKHDLKTHQVTHFNVDGIKEVPKGGRRGPGKRPKKTTCTTCMKTFSSVQALYHHRRYVHLKPADYKCKVCDKVLATPTSLKEHYRSVHLGIRYVCTIKGCSKSYSSKWVLINHENHHRRKEGKAAVEIKTKNAGKLRRGRPKRDSLPVSSKKIKTENISLPNPSENSGNTKLEYNSSTIKNSFEIKAEPDHEVKVEPEMCNAEYSFDVKWELP